MDRDAVNALAEEYSRGIGQALSMGVAAEPEAQLTVPFAAFLSRFAQEAGLGRLDLLREAQLDGVRPDFAAALDGRPCGWIELKAPGHTVVGEKWRGREKSQWALLSQLDALLVSNGELLALYVAGAPVETCALPVDGATGWDADRLRRVLEQFTLAQPRPITRVSQLADRLAPLARFLRERLAEGLEHSYASVVEAKAAWDHTMQHTTTPEEFSGDVAQVVAYSMAIAGLSGQADRNADGVVSLEEAKHALETAHRNVLAASLGPILGIPALMQHIAPEVGAITRLVAGMDVAAIERSTDSRGEPWLWFYEDFLQRYDPEARSRAGVYYTPISVVECQVRVVDALLRERFGQNLGFGAPSVVTLDPATGSGTYPLAIIDRAESVAREERGDAGAKQVAKNLTKNLLAFELLPGPYSVAHLRIGQRLAEAQGHAFQAEEIGVYLTDTLEDPSAGMPTGLFGDARVLAEAAESARRVKRDQQITVAIGNPPYDRVTSGTGGWVEQGSGSGDALFDDVIKPAQDSGVIFSAQASLYNLYVYFWRWAIWKAFQQDPKDHAVISFITASSWLTGPAFVGLRRLAQATASEIWVMDLGGEGRGARKEENVFDIQSPVAIVTLVRTGKASREATVFYRRFRGSRAEKFAALDRIQRLDAADGWEQVSAPDGAPFVPSSGGEEWTAMPQLADLFPWQQPGIMYNRAWPVASDRQTLRRRWQELLADDDADARARKYVTGNSGRTIHTAVAGLPSLASLPADAEPRPIVRVAWRSFDRQWTFDDPRLINLERPALWQALSDRQLFLVSPKTARISGGPAVTVATAVPDKHYFNNRGGKDVIPLYRDTEAAEPNVTAGLLEMLADGLGRDVTPEDLAAYVMAVAAHDGYAQTFDEALETSPVRIPLTADASLWDAAVALGERLLWLQTYGERFTSADRPRGRVPRVPGLGWSEAVTQIPADTASLSYDAASRELRVGDGVVTGVSPEVRAFSVSGMNIVDKWLGARTAKGIGRAAGKAATPLDRIRPTEWADEWNDELLDLLRVLTETVALGDQQAELLAAILAGELITAADLPVPTAAERKVPKTIKRGVSPHQEGLL